MIFKYLLFISVILITFILQTSLVVLLPYPFNLISLPIIITVLASYIFGFNTGFIIAIGIGIVFTHATNLKNASIAGSLIITTVVIKILSEKLFTNLSLYSNSVLILIGTILQILLVFGLNYNLHTRASLTFWQSQTIWQILLNILVSNILFTALISFRQELKTYLLIK